MANFAYHYTTIEALLGILKTTDLCFWATHKNFLNDRTEGIFGKAILDELLPHSLPLSILDIFILSLSEEINSLPMWNAYANQSQGVALKLNSNILQKLGSTFARCMYGEKAKEQVKQLANFLSISKWHSQGSSSQFTKNFQDTNMAKVYDMFIKNQTYLGLLYSMKDETYEYEKEIRIFSSPEPSNIKYRIRKGVIIPYIEMHLPKECLEGIIIGSANNSELLEPSLHHLLENNGYSNVEITKSTLPHRG